MPRTFQEGETHTVRRDVDKYRPYYYAAVSGDFNPIHLDPEFGQMAGLGGNILHGMCTLAWAAEVAVEYLGESRRLKSIRARFSRPVQIGETLTFTVRAAKRDGDVLRGELSAVNSKGEEVLKNGVFEGNVGAA